MSFIPTIRMLHAVTCLGICLLAIGLVLAVAIGTLNSILSRVNSLADAASQKAEFSSRLDEVRIDTREKLNLVGADPNDLPSLADPEKAKLIVLGACEEIADAFNGTCAIEEAPITETLSRHRARLNAVGDFPALSASLVQAIVPPIRAASVSIRANDSSPRVEFSVVLEVVGAHADGERP